MKLSAFNDLISQTHDVFAECQKKFYNADKALKDCDNEHDREGIQFIKDIHFHRQDTVFCALNSLIIARDILKRFGYIEED